MGTKYRNRTCLIPEPEIGVPGCPGDTNQTVNCNATWCSEDCPCGENARIYYLHVPLFTARILRIGEGNIFSLCVSSHLDRGRQGGPTFPFHCRGGPEVGGGTTFPGGGLPTFSGRGVPTFPGGGGLPTRWSGYLPSQAGGTYLPRWGGGYYLPMPTFSGGGSQFRRVPTFPWGFLPSQAGGLPPTGTA